MHRIEDAAPQRDQRDEKKIRKRDPRQRHGQRELLRVAREAGRQHVDHLWRKHERKRQQRRLRCNQQREDAIAEQVRRLRPALRADARISRNEGGVERAFGKNRAKMVGQTECDEERIGDRPGAKDRRQHNVAQEAGRARGQRIAADRENPLDHGVFVSIGRQSRRKQGSAVHSHTVRIPAYAKISGKDRYPASARHTAAMMWSCTGGSR